MEKSIFLIVVIAVLSNSSIGKKRDPLCLPEESKVTATALVRMNQQWGYAKCGKEETCHVVLEGCDAEGLCKFNATCLSTRPYHNHLGLCPVGEPLLTDNQGIKVDIFCGASTPCPKTAYCNTRTQDYSFCCRSDPDNPIKNGTCPTPKITDSLFCVDTCGNDGDCPDDQKCCVNGCRRECTKPTPPPPPPPPHVCETIQCPLNMYCRRDEPCPPYQQCFPEGSCSPCPLMNCPLRCRFGLARDPRGCQICQCSATQTQTAQPARPPGPPNTGMPAYRLYGPPVPQPNSMAPSPYFTGSQVTGMNGFAPRARPQMNMFNRMMFMDWMF